MKVLIIDDDEDSRSIARLSLESLANATVIEASGGQEGFDLAKIDKPDVILLDLLMPNLDGRATFHLLRSNANTATIPIIFLTIKGIFDEFDELKANSTVLVDLIVKPFDPTFLAQQIQRILI